MVDYTDGLAVFFFCTRPAVPYPGVRAGQSPAHTGTRQADHSPMFLRTSEMIRSAGCGAINSRRTLINGFCGVFTELSAEVFQTGLESALRGINTGLRALAVRGCGGRSHLP